MRLFIALLLALFFSFAAAETLEGRVVAVIDGDTVDVLNGRTMTRVRIAGIDAPEKRQPYGMAAKQRMSDLVMGKDVSVEHTKADRYKRIVGVVRVAGMDAGLELVQGGLAWHYKKYEREQSDADRVAYSRAEYSAKSAGAGLWRDSDPTPPWGWRRKTGAQK